MRKNKTSPEIRTWSRLIINKIAKRGKQSFSDVVTLSNRAKNSLHRHPQAQISLNHRPNLLCGKPKQAKLG
jgi:capsule polysaccharide export protein KpsC/LpsZ